MDKLSKEQRSRCMASIRSKDTKPETLNHIFIEDHKVRRYELPEEETMMAAEPEI